MARIRCGTSGPGSLVSHGARLQVEVGFDPNYHQPVGRPAIPDDRYTALIDTGAGISCIDEQLAERLRLPRHEDTGMVWGVVGEGYRATRYMAHLYLPGFPHVYYVPVRGLPLAERIEGVHLLLGRDLLQHYWLSYGGRNGDVFLDDSTAGP